MIDQLSKLLLPPVLAQTPVKLNLPGSITADPNNADILAGRIIGIVFIFIGAAAFIGIIYSGVMMITSNGDAAKFAAGRKNLLWSIIGIIVVALSYFIVQFTGLLATDLTR